MAWASCVLIQIKHHQADIGPAQRFFQDAGPAEIGEAPSSGWPCHRLGSRQCSAGTPAGQLPCQLPGQQAQPWQQCNRWQPCAAQKHVMGGCCLVGHASLILEVQQQPPPCTRPRHVSQALGHRCDLRRAPAAVSCSADACRAAPALTGSCQAQAVILQHAAQAGRGGGPERTSSQMQMP